MKESEITNEIVRNELIERCKESNYLFNKDINIWDEYDYANYNNILSQ